MIQIFVQVKHELRNSETQNNQHVERMCVQRRTTNRKFLFRSMTRECWWENSNRPSPLCSFFLYSAPLLPMSSAFSIHWQATVNLSFYLLLPRPLYFLSIRFSAFSSFAWTRKHIWTLNTVLCVQRQNIIKCFVFQFDSQKTFLFILNLKKQNGSQWYTFYQFDEGRHRKSNEVEEKIYREHFHLRMTMNSCHK